MLTRGEYRSNDNSYGVICFHSKSETEVILTLNGNVWSAYKHKDKEEFSYNNKIAKGFWDIIKKGLKGCTAKNVTAAPFVLGTVSRHRFVKTKIDFLIDKYMNELAGVEITGDNLYISLEYTDLDIRPDGIPYIKLSTQQEFTVVEDDADRVQVKTLEEISLEKDINWLRTKKYYVVNNDEIAEKLFQHIENWNGPIAYDTETTGLKINMFSKVNSAKQKELEEYNKDKPDNEKIRADRLVGIIFCVEPDVSYYFPCFNRKFDNLYENKSSEIRKRLITNIKSKYTVGEFRDLQTDMARYFRETPDDEISSDCLLMERCRKILTEGHIVAHNGTFEWKVSYCYDIDINLKDDTMILHQILYKFRSTTSNAGEPSNLKYLAKRELGIDQLELYDFFVDYKEDDSGEVRSSKKKKKKSSNIDFSYMDYNGTRAYAPTDGDVTLQLLFKYKRDMIENHKEQEYIYNVEVVVACAVGYMEFYGLRLDEDKINSVRDKYKIEMIEIEHQIRKLAGFVEDAETNCYESLTGLKEREFTTEELDEYIKNYREAVENSKNPINLAAPAQVAKLFFEKLGYPFEGDKMSVAKKAIKPLLKMKNEDGTDRCPAVHLYSKWKQVDTLLTKFFDNLQNFMYPGGFIFCSYGQISTATGRMNCKKPNAQQFPKDITKIVIPRPRHIMFDADYSQIEYRTLVAMANEPFLLELFKDPDNDYHTLMASLMYSVPYASVTPKMRGDAKSFNFGIPYGMGFKSLAILLTGMSGPSQVEEAKEKYELYFKDQPNVRRFFDHVKEMALVNKYTKTYWNRYRYYSFTDAEGKVSNSKRAMALRQAGNAVIQGTAADIFKISVARNFSWIRRNGLLGILLIVNMVHDEQLMEMNCDVINTQAAFKHILDNMEFKIEGFPPLYIGAGFGFNWAEAKGKMAEIHPKLARQLHQEAQEMNLYSDKPVENTDVAKYYTDRVNRFRFEKVRDYLIDPNNFGQDLHPAIGNLINLQFKYGLEKTLEGDELTLAALAKFIEVNGLNVNPDNFKSMVEQEEDIEDDVEYSDDEEELDLEEGDISDNSFALIDEDDKLFGVSLQDLIREFGLLVSKERRVCGVDTRVLPYKKKDELVDFLAEHEADSEEEGAMQVVFLMESNVLFNTGVWVKNIDGSLLSSRLKINTLLYS